MLNKETIFQIVRLNDYKSLDDVSDSYDINMTNEDGQSLMHEAASFNSLECAIKLLERNCPINTKDHKGMTPLHFAAANSSYAVAKLLIKHKADASETDIYGNQPLWTATFNARGVYDLVKLFSDSNASSDHKNNNNKSPLDFAEQIKDKELVAILINLKN